MKIEKMVISTIFIGLAAFLVFPPEHAFASAPYYPAIQTWALIVCGGSHVPLPFDQACFEAYSVLTYHCFQPSHIYYVSWNLTRPVSNQTWSKATVEYAITTWLKNRSDSNDVIFMYFCDHGELVNNWSFDINGEYISAQEFKNWLSELTYGHLFFVVDACYSGSVIPYISSPNNIVVTSTNATDKAAFDMPTMTMNFSHPFFQDLNQTHTAGTAFRYAYNVVKSNPVWGPLQEPLLDDNGTGSAFSACWVPGDINGDGRVSLSDLILLANAYNTKPGDLKWNPAADLNGGGQVDLADLTILTRNYGYPTA